ncbi:MAG: GxxExxY protein [Chloroflexota bacterium]|nr:GxxExxY protein [Chloroflexota bacterium]
MNVGSNHGADFNQSDPLTYQIIGAAIEVHRELGPKLLESIYEEALCIELDLRQLRYERQKKIELNYKGHEIGTFIVDIIVENSVIVELKSVANLAPVHEAQLISYLKLAKLRRGLLINFSVTTLREGIKRIIV